MKKLSRREILSTGAAAPLVVLAAGCTQEPEQSNSGLGGGAPPPSQAVAVEFAFHGLVMLRRHKVGGAQAASVLCMNARYQQKGHPKDESLTPHQAVLRVIDGQVTSIAGLEQFTSGLGQLVRVPAWESCGTTGLIGDLKFIGDNEAEGQWESLSWVPSLSALHNKDLAADLKSDADLAPNKDQAIFASFSFSNGAFHAMPPLSDLAYIAKWRMTDTNGNSTVRMITDRFGLRGEVDRNATVKLDWGNGKSVEISPKSDVQTEGPRPIRIELVHMPPRWWRHPGHEEIHHARAYHFVLKDDKAKNGLPKRAQLANDGTARPRTGGGDPICMACQIDV